MRNPHPKSNNKQWNTKPKLLSLAFLFILPMLMALGAYLARDYLPFSPKTEGTLIIPPLSSEQLELTGLDEKTVSIKTLEDSWWLIYVAPKTCQEEDCAIQAAKIRSVHMALNKNIPRVSRLLLLQASSLPATQVEKAAEDTQLTVDFIKNPDYLLNGCPAEKTLAEGLFIMDPLGNIMLCYKPKQEAHAILKDVEKLLKASQIG